MHLRIQDMTISQRIGWFTGPRDENGCRDWLASLTTHGYPQLKVRRESLKPTRIILGLMRGDRRVAMHLCDRPSCVEPTHLRIGTYAENSADRDRKGRGLTGERNPRSKLTDVKVREIRARRAAGEEGASIAKDFGITRANVYSLALSKTWKHVV